MLSIDTFKKTSSDPLSSSLLIGRQSDKPPAEPFRATMKEIWGTVEVQTLYHQRWQVETVNSMMKRNYGSALRARTPERREREMLPKAMTHNIAI